jgi:5'(3')-deoxyribonucleotidase
MDEVIADTLGEHLRRYNEATLEEIVLEDLWGKGLWDVVSTDRQELLRELLHA